MFFAMKKFKCLVAGFVLSASLSIFFNVNVTFSSKNMLLELSQIESLARGEGDLIMGCCTDPDSYCRNGDIILAYHRLCEM